MLRVSCVVTTAAIVVALPLIAAAQNASSAAVFMTPHFAFYSDLEMNVHDALVAASAARRSKRPELFAASAEKACFDALPADVRDGWTRAVDAYLTRPSTPLQRVLLRLVIARLVQADGVTDVANRMFLDDSARVRAGARTAYQRCRWTTQDAANRSWIARLQPLLARHEDALGRQLPQLFQTPWAGLPFRVDVVDYVDFAGANTASPDYPTAHIMISSTNASNQGAAALEVVFHEACHFLTMANSPLTTTLDIAAREASYTPPPNFVHQVHFFMTGEAVRRAFAGGGDPPYTPYLLSLKLFDDRFREIVQRVWPPYMDGTRTMREAADDLIRALREAR